VNLMNDEIERLRRDFAILAHNYQRPEVQDTADFVADSLDLATYAAQTDKEHILMAGVTFMAETAAILSGKKVYMPDPSSSCPMASMCTRDMVISAKRDHPDARVVMYINTIAETKTVADVICTSANAVKIVESMDSEEIIFVPDANLASYVSRFTAKTIIPIPANGHCATHHMLTAEEIHLKRKEHTGAEVLVHPECRSEVIDVADFAMGTSGMVKHVRESEKESFIIGTEVGLLHRLKKENPAKAFIPASDFLVCPSMKMHTLEKIAIQMKMKENVVYVPPKIAEQARKPLLAMLEI
jgi:quinolinate synthase